MIPFKQEPLHDYVVFIQLFAFFSKFPDNPILPIAISKFQWSTMWDALLKSKQIWPTLLPRQVSQGKLMNL